LRDFCNALVTVIKKHYPEYLKDTSNNEVFLKLLEIARQSGGVREGTTIKIYHANRERKARRWF